MDEGKAADEKAPKRKRAAWWVEILIAIAVVLVVVGIAIPAYNSRKTETRRTEAKKGLHDIQIAVERFATDTGGTYPEYLIGGSALPGKDPMDPWALTSDPLLHSGYLLAYPRNPFAVQQTVKAMQEQYKDPFRPGTKESQFGYRFGEDYMIMGQVLADFRYPKLPGQKLTKINGVYYYADTEYPFWDIWPPGARKPKPFLPGEFFYKSVGTLVVTDKQSLNPDLPIVPAEVGIYLLGLYGGPNDRGKDVLGAEPEVILRPNLLLGNAATEFAIPAWTRSINTPNKDGKFLGSAYGLYRGEGDDQFDYGNPNGIPDGIILMVGTCYPE
jgi:hypothetical protein